MQQVASFDITIGAGIATDHEARNTNKKLRAGIFSAWSVLQELAMSPNARCSDTKSRPLPGYYGSAYDKANADVPVATFRGLL
jgi:hypothetical protein